MLLDNQLQQNTKNTSGVSFEQKSVNKKRLIIVASVIVFLCIIFTVFITTRGGSNELEDKAAAAAREVIPNAEAEEVIVADGFAVAIVYVPKDNTQLGSGNISIFSVGEDGSMTYLASASYFNPLDLLEFGIPFETQAKLLGSDVNDIKNELADFCNYGFYDTPGYTGFDGSFRPDGWEIDSASLDGITQALNSVLRTANSGKNNADKVVCVSTKIEGSDVVVDPTTFASTFSLDLKFVTSDGVITDHLFTFTDGPMSSRIYTLDGQII